MARREREKENRRLAHKENLRTRYHMWKEERKLKKQGYTNKSRAEYVGNHRRIDKFLNRTIFILFLLNVIVWLVVLFI